MKMKTFLNFIILLVCNFCFNTSYINCIIENHHLESHQNYNDLRSAKQYLGFYYQSTAGPDFAPRKDLVCISKETVPDSIQLMPFGEKYWRANMSQGIPLIKLNTGARISYLSAMADISKRFLSLMDYEIRCKKRSSYRLFNIRINEGGGALDDIIIGKIYSDLIAEFCNILKSLDEAVNNNEERYFKFNEVTKAVDDVDIYGWREIAHRLLDSLLIVFPDTQYFHAGKKVAQTVLKDIFILNIVKEQILKHIEYDLNIGREFIDFKSYIRAVTAFDGNLFGELSLKDQYDILSGYWKIILDKETIHHSKTFQPLTDPKVFQKLLNGPDEETKLLGKEIILLFSFPEQAEIRKRLWNPLYFTIELLLTGKKSKFQSYFENQIKKSYLNEKIKLIKTILRLKIQGDNYKTSYIHEMFQCKKIKENDVWENLSGRKVVSWFHTHWDQQEDLLKKFQKKEEELQDFTDQFFKSKLDDPDQKLQIERSLSAELGYWINTDLIKDIWKFLRNPYDELKRQHSIIKKAKEKYYLKDNIYLFFSKESI